MSNDKEHTGLYVDKPAVEETMIYIKGLSIIYCLFETKQKANEWDLMLDHLVHNACWSTMSQFSVPYIYI